MNLVVVIVAALFAVMGVAALAVPRLVWEPFGVVPSTPASRNEVRAVYGGFGVAIAALLLVAEFQGAAFRDGVVLAAAVSLFGMGGGRLVSAVIEPKSIVGYPAFFLGVELLGGGLLLLAR
jgi:hypothetical protein